MGNLGGHAMAVLFVFGVPESLLQKEMSEFDRALRDAMREADPSIDVAIFYPRDLLARSGSDLVCLLAGVDNGTHGRLVEAAATALQKQFPKSTVRTVPNGLSVV
jgi:hypothetical protein